MGILWEAGKGKEFVVFILLICTIWPWERPWLGLEATRRNISSFDTINPSFSFNCIQYEDNHLIAALSQGLYLKWAQISLFRFPMWPSGTIIFLLGYTSYTTQAVIS